MKVAVPYHISSPYEQLLTAIQDAAEEFGTGDVKKRGSLVDCFRKDPSGVAFECYVYLGNWRWRPGETNERVSIMLHAVEVMSKNWTTLVSSNVSLSYLSKNGAQLEVMHTVHFDYSAPQTCHPLFHAQLTREPIVPSEEELLEMNCDVSISGAVVPCFKNARIPTCDMTLSSVLLCLAADHIGGEIFKRLRGKLYEIQGKLPLPTFDALRISLGQEQNHLRSSHWFAHMQ